VVANEKRRGNGHRIRDNKCNLNTRKTLSVGVVRLSRKSVNSSFLEMFKKQLDTVLINML